MLTIASFYSATDFYISFSFRQPRFALLLDACIKLSSDLASIYNICSSPLHYSTYQMQSKQKKKCQPMQYMQGLQGLHHLSSLIDQNMFVFYSQAYGQTLGLVFKSSRWQLRNFRLKLVDRILTVQGEFQMGVHQHPPQQ